MPELNDKFTANISRQSIFQTFYEPLLNNGKSSLIKRSKLVCRNNSDLFYANENLVRVCTVNPYSSNFKLLENENGSFKIKSLEMNSSGTLLALLGDEDLVVLSLLNSINGINDSIIPTKSYKLESIGGKIVKVIWQTISTNDCSIIVLNDKSEIKLFDLSISTSIPQVQVKLKENDLFKYEDAVSITFGSQENISGSLTLYVATSKGNIYSMFPFIHKNAKLSVKTSSLNNFVKESQHLIRTIEEENPEEESFNLKSSPLRKSLIMQYEYVTYLAKQLESNIKPRIEKRNILSNYPEDLFIVNQNLPESFTPCLQGPICKVESTIQDITELVTNDNVSILAGLSLNSSSEPVLTYFAQFRPLIMKWNNEKNERIIKPEQNKKENNNDIISLKSSKPYFDYKRPAKGFGFIDLNEQECEYEVQHIVKTTENNYNSDIEYWNKNFKSLSILSAEVIPLIAKSNEVFFDKLNNKESKLRITIGGKVIICDASRWVDDIISSINGGCLSDVLVESDFKSVSNGERINSIAYIQDKISNTGEYLIILRSKKDFNLDICQISNNFSMDNQGDFEDKIADYSEKYESILKKEPFEELDHELLSIKKFKNNSLLQGVNLSKVNDSITVGPEILKNINALSNNTINQVSQFTKFTLHLNFRVLTQVDELRNQIEMISKLQEDKIKNDELNKINLKINKLILKQEKIDAKIKKVQDKLIESIQRIMYSRTLPLSTAEKNWFKEINAVNSELSQDTNEKDSLIKVLKNLEAQVKLLVKDSKTLSNSDTDSLKEKLTQHQLYKNVNKLKSWLIQEGTLIEATKIKLEENLKKLQI